MGRIVGSRAGWVVLTSTNAVDALFAVLHDTRDLGGLRVAAVGRATAAALRQRGVVADLVPPKANSESLVASFPPAPRGGGRVLLPQADRAGPELAHALVGLRWEVEVVKAYRTVAADVPSALLERARAADAICFTSGSTVDSWVDAAGAATPPVVATIGPMTTAAATAAGLAVTAEAHEATFASLVDALVAAFATRDAAAAVAAEAASIAADLDGPDEAVAAALSGASAEAPVAGEGVPTEDPAAAEG